MQFFKIIVLLESAIFVLKYTQMICTNSNMRDDREENEIMNKTVKL